MESIFYLTSSRLYLEDIATFSVEAGYRCRIPEGPAPVPLWIYTNDFFVSGSYTIRCGDQERTRWVSGNLGDIQAELERAVAEGCTVSVCELRCRRDHWECDDYGESFWEELEPAEAEALRTLAPESILDFRYHETFLHSLLQFLARLLERYGGWLLLGDDWSSLDAVYDHQRLQQALRDAFAPTG